MKLSKREKNLLIVLSVVLVLIGYYKFIISTQFKSLDEKRKDKAHYEDELLKIQTVIASEKELDDRFELINNEINLLSEKYFPETDQSRFILLINELLGDTGLFVDNISFSPQRTEGIGDAQVEIMSVTLPYEGKYSSLLSFLEKIHKHTPKPIIQNMDIKTKEKELLSGSIILDFYSLPDIIEDSSTAYLFDSSEINSDPFHSFEDDFDLDEDFIVGEDFGEYGEVNLSNVKISFDSSRTLIEGFDNKILDFVPSHPSIKGEINSNKNSKQGTTSLGVHYNFPPIEEQKQVHIVLNSGKAIISKPPENIGLWVYSYDATKHNIELIIKDKNGEKHNIVLSDNINWIGWKHLKANVPKDSFLYPLEVDRIIVGIDSTSSGKGTLLFDALEAFYTIDIPVIEENTIGGFILYNVQVGDTLSNISKKFFNDISYKQDIKKYNGINSNSDLKPGKIIIIPNIHNESGNKEEL